MREASRHVHVKKHSICHILYSLLQHTPPFNHTYIHTVPLLNGAINSVTDFVWLCEKNKNKNIIHHFSWISFFQYFT